MRSFNTAGPVNPTDHYLIAPLSRIDADEVLGLVRDKKYFVLHAPRQTGKTSALLALADVLNRKGYRCVYVTVETARTARDDAYARDLGLVARDAPLRVANPIYAEVLPRDLAWVAQETLDLSPPRYVRADGSLDAALLMAEFQSFFRRTPSIGGTASRTRRRGRSCSCRRICSAW